MNHFHNERSKTSHYLGIRNSKSLLDVKQCTIIAGAIQDLILIEQIVHSEDDVRFVHLSSALTYNMVTIEGVMHHHQNYCFIICEQRDNITQPNEKKQDET